MSCPSVLNISTFFKHFIFNTNSNHLSEPEKRRVKIASFALSFFTLTALPRICSWKWSQHSKEILKARYHDVIKQSTALPPSDRNDKSHKIPSHQIINGLFLGNAYGCMQASGLANITTQEPDHSENKPMDTSNPKKFKTVITACHVDDFAENYYIKDENTAEVKLKRDDLARRLKAGFEESQIEWKYVGRTIYDKETGWIPMVHDCTFEESESQLSLYDRFSVNDGKGAESNLADKANRDAKEARIPKDVNVWFNHIYTKLDEAVFEGKNTLLHCRVGQSRSATILAAYLIKTFDVSAQEAIQFLRHKRLCVDPKPCFVEELKKYATKLAEARQLA